MNTGLVLDGKTVTYSNGVFSAGSSDALSFAELKKTLQVAREKEWLKRNPLMVDDMYTVLNQERPGAVVTRIRGWNDHRKGWLVTFENGEKDTVPGVMIIDQAEREKLDTVRAAYKQLSEELDAFRDKHRVMPVVGNMTYTGKGHRRVRVVGDTKLEWTVRDTSVKPTVEEVTEIGYFGFTDEGLLQATVHGETVTAPSIQALLPLVEARMMPFYASEVQYYNPLTGMVASQPFVWGIDKDFRTTSDLFYTGTVDAEVYREICGRRAELRKQWDETTKNAIARFTEAWAAHLESSVLKAVA